MKPNDLDDPSPVEPDNALLSRVRTRGRALHRRRRAQRWVGAGAAALIVVLAVAAALMVGRGSDSKPSSPPSTSTTVPTVSSADIAGSWRPVSVAGYDGLLTSPPLGSEPRVRFGRERLSGEDGCNGFGGRYDLGSDGSFRQTSFGSTAVRCVRAFPPLRDAFADARRLELRDGRLVLLADGGEQLAELARPVVTTRIELPSDTMVAGTTMRGRVVVDNETGHVIKAQGCGSLFAVALSNDAYQPQISWTLCLQNLDIPLGVSTYPAFVPALTNGDGVRPLAPGTYEAKLYQSTHVVPDPPPVRIQVVAPR